MMQWSWAVDPLAIVAAVILIVRWIRKGDKRLDSFLRDWTGEPPRPGVPGRAGVMERLAVIEVIQVDTRNDLAAHIKDHPGGEKK